MTVSPKTALKPRGWRLAKAGAAHPRSKIVVTPKGRFDNATLAGKAHGLTRQAAAKRAREGIDGWFYTTYHYPAAPFEG